MKRRLIVGLVSFLAVALCGGLIWFNFFRDNLIAGIFAKMQPPAQTVSAGKVAASTWRPAIQAIGSARADKGVELAVQISGIVKEIRFTPNVPVRQGELMVQLDDAIERADLIDAEANLKLAQANLERTTQLRSRGFDTQVTFDQVIAQNATARSRLDRLQATIDQKALKAPFSGTPGIARINPGQYLQPGTVVATFQSLSDMRVDFTVPEQSLLQVRLEQPVRVFTTDNDAGQSGRIVGIDPRVDPQTRLVAVQARVENVTPGTIVPGQFLRVRVELPEETNIVSVPQTAIVSSLYGDYVFRIEAETVDGKEVQRVRQVFVKVGRREGQRAEVLSGLEVDQIVALSGQNKLQAGGLVKIDNSIDVTRIPDGSPRR